LFLFGKLLTGAAEGLLPEELLPELELLVPLEFELFELLENVRDGLLPDPDLELYPPRGEPELL
jgi:hypothetical protein